MRLSRKFEAEAVTNSALALLPALFLILTSCSSTPKVEKTSTTAYREGTAGGTFVETYDLTATVTDIDVASRKVRLVAPDGSGNTFIAKPADRSIETLRVGDQVQANVTRQLVVFLRKDGAPLNDRHSVASAQGFGTSQPGVLSSDTVQRLAKVAAVDPRRHQATLEFADGTSKTFAVRKDVELQRVKPGEEVVIQTTSFVVLRIQKQ